MHVVKGHVARSAQAPSQASVSREESHRSIKLDHAFLASQRAAALDANNGPPGSEAGRWRETMKIMLRAAIAALSFANIGPAIASEGDGGTAPNTFFTELPGVVAQAPVQNAPSIAAAQNGQVGQTYMSGSGARST